MHVVSRDEFPLPLRVVGLPEQSDPPSILTQNHFSRDTSSFSRIQQYSHDYNFVNGTVSLT